MIEGDLKVYGGYFSVDVYPFPERFVGARDRLVIRWDFVKGGLGRKCLYRKFGHVPSVKTRVEDSATNRQNVIWKERCFQGPKYKWKGNECPFTWTKPRYCQQTYSLNHYCPFLDLISIFPHRLNPVSDLQSFL